MSEAGLVRKTVTVVFADVSGSTALGERLDPEAVRALMGRWFEEARSCLERHGGTVEKFIGDAVMAVFGIPLAHEDDALRAVRAAAEMRDALARLNAELPLAVRIGVNTGEVVAGEGQTLVTGDPVNVAARLEQVAEPGQILLGETTYRLVRDAVRAEAVEPLALKGKAEPVPAWRLLEVIEGAPTFARRLDTPMVGRTEELARLRAAFERAAGERRPELVTVLGPPGIGKSRLAAELTRSVEANATVLTARCLSYGEGLSFQPLTEIVRGLEIERALASVDDAQLIATRLRSILGPDDVPEAIQEIFWAIRRLFEALGATQPVVLVLEDLHWAEPTFLDLVEYLAEWTRAAPLLLLVLARTEFGEERPGWRGERLALEPLSEDEAEALVDGLRGGLELTRETRARLAGAAEGNPLFLEQMLAALTESGAPGDELALPPTIQALLSSRLDQLAADERAVIERAAVLGRAFSWRAVAQLCTEQPEAQVLSSLLALMRKGLLAPDRSDPLHEEAFRFRHALIRDAAYDAVPKAVRATLHESVADWLEGGAEEEDEIVGYHLEQAYRYRAQLGALHGHELELAQRAGKRLAAAGQRAFRRGDMPAAAALLARATGLLPAEDPERVELLPDLGVALFGVGQLEKADAVLTEAIEHARSSGDRKTEWRAIVGRSQLRVSTEGARRGLEEMALEAERAIEVLSDLGDELGLSRAWSLLSDVRLMSGRAATAAEAAERAAEHARRAGSAGDEARALATLGYLVVFGPTPVQEETRRCEELLERVRGNGAAEALILSWLSTLRAMQGRFGEAEARGEQAEAVFRDLGLRWHAAVGLYLRGWGAFFAGDPVAAERSLLAAQETFREIGERYWLTAVLTDLPHVLYEQGRYEEAFGVSETMAAAPATYDLEWQAVQRGVRAKVLARRGGLDEALLLAREAVALAEQTDFLTTHGLVLLDLAEVLRLAGRREEASAALKEAAQLFERKGSVVSAAKARSLLAELAAAR